MQALGWLIALAVLLVIEIVTLGLTTIWFAGGCLVSFVVAVIGGPLWLQILLFLVVSLVLLIFTRPVAVRYFNRNRVKTNSESLIGLNGKVTEKIDNFNQTGKAVINGLEWTARAQKDTDVIEEGELVKILEIRGVKLIVEKTESEKE